MLQAHDFMLLCKDLLVDFKRYNKPYPSSTQIESLMSQERKWVAYKEYLLKQIQVRKKLDKKSFDWLLRQGDSTKLPKKVGFQPDSKIKTGEMHCKPQGRKNMEQFMGEERGRVGRSAAEGEGLEQLDVGGEERRRFKLLGVTPKSVQMLTNKQLEM